MKRLLVVIPILFMLLASRCTTKEKTPIEIFNDSIRSFIEKNADDPKSYQPIETVVSDTVTFMQNLDRRVKFKTGMANGYESIVKGDEDMVKEFGKKYQDNLDRSKAELREQREEIERTQKLMDSLATSTNPNAVAAYILKHSCRMNNKLGALVKSDVFFEFTPNYKITNVYEQSGKPSDYPGGFPGRVIK